MEAAARRAIAGVDSAIVTSYCADAPAATKLVVESDVPVRAFYDLDSPVTLAAIAAGERVAYVGADGYRGFDLVLSYAGGRALEELRTVLGATRVAPLYGSVDPEVHERTAPVEIFRADLSYLGTYSPDRQERLEALFIEPARLLPKKRFLIGGAQYPAEFAPPDHPAFYSSGRLTLNVTRAAMADFGWCPSGRLFEAAACGTPILSDTWAGLDRFFEPGREILVARTSEEARDAIEAADAELARMAAAARERVLAEHTSEIRARELIDVLEAAAPRRQEVA